MAPRGLASASAPRPPPRVCCALTCSRLLAALMKAAAGGQPAPVCTRIIMSLSSGCGCLYPENFTRGSRSSSLRGCAKKGKRRVGGGGSGGNKNTAAQQPPPRRRASKGTGDHAHAHEVAHGVVFSLNNEAACICHLGVRLVRHPGAEGKRHGIVQVRTMARQARCTRRWPRAAEAAGASSPH